MNSQLDILSAELTECMLAERRVFARRLHGLRRRVRDGQPTDRALSTLTRDMERSSARYARRLALAPTPVFPDELPVSARREVIAEAIARHQVVVIAGETGSGKTTQIPKICLQLGRGVAGMIGHTQPRRIAARSVAARIAEELETQLGQAVGYKIRFSDRIGENTHIKLVTDGMLLAEIPSDPLLEQYDTLIIDEAHERTLNIDFLLGYLKRLLPKRPDLKVIITSATINTESFSRFFEGAPIIEVSGRTYPVEVLYRPVVGDEDERDRDQVEAILDAVDEVGRLDPLGDVLIFLPGEREIRETAEALHKHRLPHTEVLPLFSRLSAAEQDRVFKPHAGRRIVLATNVAETSLTVPGIRFVIDPGLARISRYSPRTKVQRLPIEPVSQASANQRSGRCGRIAAGVCVRLYSEEDFLARPAYTDPEILRTNLASVILSMLMLRLGEVEDFPFIEPPDRRLVNDGFQVLQELGAVDDGRILTETGRQLARLPVDPRVGRMLLAADHERSLTEVLIIAAALTVQDPRERPMEAQQQADEAHARWRDERSDFLGFVKLWQGYHEQARHLSRNKLHKHCRASFLSYLRMREWHDVHSQLLSLAGEMKLRLNEEPASYDAVHRAILAGLLSSVAVKAEVEAPTKKPMAKGAEPRRREATEYDGARNIKLALFPGSALRKKPPKWIVAAELAETSRLFARTAAAIQPEWLEALGGHLLKRHVSEPHWEQRAATVVAYEQLTLYGLIVVARRRVNFGPIDPVLARELFIRHALVRGEYRSDAPFFQHNRQLLAEVEELEAKARRRDVLVDEETLFAFYDERLPEDIHSGRGFEGWRRKAEREDPQRLFLTRELLMRHQAGGVTVEAFPAALPIGGLSLALRYRFEPGHEEDGVTVVVPVAALGLLSPARFQWLVPGLLEEKVVALIKSLPKSLRRNFVPASDFARACLEVIEPSEHPLTEVLANALKRMTGVAVSHDAWNPQSLPPHLLMRFEVVDEQGKPLSAGRDLQELQGGLSGVARASLEAHPVTHLERDGITDWDFGELPEQLEVKGRGLALFGYPGLVDEGSSVALRVFETPQAAQESTAEGLCRLYMLRAQDKVRYLAKNLPGVQQMCLHYSPAGKCDELKDDLVKAVFRRVYVEEQPPPRTREAFEAHLEAGRSQLLDAGNRLASAVGEALAEYHSLSKLLNQGGGPDRLAALAEIKAQLSRLIYPGFVTHTPSVWLRHLPRYLKAARVRLEKLPRDPQRDRQLASDVRRLEEAWLARRERLGLVGQGETDFNEFRWLLEELRVSLFAQELRTAMPVSVQRLDKRWRELVA